MKRSRSPKKYTEEKKNLSRSPKKNKPYTIIPDILDIIAEYASTDTELLPWINEKKLVMTGLCANPNAIEYIRLNFNLKNLNEDCWRELSRNPKAVRILNKYKSKINRKTILLNPNAISLIEDLVDENPDTIDWSYLSSNPNAVDILKMYPNKIDWDFLSKNEGAIDMIEQRLKRYPETINNFYFSQNIGAENLFYKYPDKLDISGLCANQVGLGFIWHELSIDPESERIDWNALSANPEAIDILDVYPEKINWVYLSSNPKAMDILKKNQKKIDWTMFSANPSIFGPNKLSIKNELIDL